MAETQDIEVAESTKPCEISNGRKMTTPITQEFCRCAKCGFMLRKSDKYRPADESYSQTSRIGSIKQLNHLRLKNIERTLKRRLGRYLSFKKPLKICEIGFAEGFLVERFAQQGHIVWGIELDKHYYESVLQKMGSFENVTLHCGRLEDVILPPEFFDLVYAIDVVEHLSDLNSTIEKVAKSIGVGGYLFLETPNGDAQREMRLFKDSWSHFKDPTHREIFTSKSIKILLQSCGFEVIRIDKPIIQSITFEARSILIYLNADFQNPLIKLLLIPLLSAFLFPARVIILPHNRPNMQIVARRNSNKTNSQVVFNLNTIYSD